MREWFPGYLIIFLLVNNQDAQSTLCTCQITAAELFGHEVCHSKHLYDIQIRLLPLHGSCLWCPSVLEQDKYLHYTYTSVVQQISIYNTVKPALKTTCIYDHLSIKTTFYRSRGILSMLSNLYIKTCV